MNKGETGNMDSGQPKADVSDKIAEIKQHMPGVYASIQRKAAQIGDEAYKLVRRGLRGEPRCFYAMEGGRVVGTPFDIAHPDMVVASIALLEFGSADVCIWPEPPVLPAQGGDHGKA